MTYYDKQGVALDIQQKAIDAAEALIDGLKNAAKEDLFNHIENIPTKVRDILFPQDGFDEHTNVKIKELYMQFLPVACERGEKDFVMMLLHQGVDPRLRGNEGTPLEISTVKGNGAVIEILVSFEQGLLHDITQLQSCLCLACRWGHLDLVHYWIKQLSEIQGELSDFTFAPEYDPLKAARAGDHDDITRQLLLDVYATTEISEYCSSQKQLTQSDYRRKTAKWSNRNLPTFDCRWLHPDDPKEFLVNINLSNNALYNIPEDLMWGLPHLEIMNLSHCSLRQIPNTNSDRNLQTLGLQELDLSYNKLRQVPSDLFMISPLKTLYLQYNAIHTIKGVSTSDQANAQTAEPNEALWRCENLKILSVEHNQLSEIPSGIYGARDLETLNVYNNQLIHLPFPWTCPLLTLQASNNHLSGIEDMYNWRRTLKKLDLSVNAFKEFPLTVCKLFALEDLDLSHNEIQKLPDEREWKTYRLRILNLANNQIMCINNDLKDKLTKSKTASGKRTVWKRFTGVKDCPQWLLEVSSFQSAGECVFPGILSTRLQDLNLNFNRLQEIPESICELKMLQMLHISGNTYMRRLPKSLGLLRHLFTFDLEGMNITDPKEVAQIFRAKREDINITSQIVQALRESLHNYQPHRGVKMMMIGPPKSGKTKLVQRLAGEKLVTYKDRTPHEDDVVAVHKWTRTKPSALYLGSQSIEFTIWDLKGGMENIVISQTLFTPNTIYILVWNVNDSQYLPEIRAWMLNVKILAPGCRIIAVGSHVDCLESPEINANLSYHLAGEPSLLGLLSDEILVDVYHQKGRGLTTLSQVIFEYAMKMTVADLDKPSVSVSLIGRKVPKTFLDMKEELSKKLTRQRYRVHEKPRIMTEEKYIKTFKGIEGSWFDTEKQVNGLVRFLRDAGSLIHVSDHTYRLTNLYFLDPNWLCKVLLSPVKAKAKGTLDRRQPQRVSKSVLKEHCNQVGFGKGRFEEYLELLGRFEIAIKATPDSYFLPALLTSDRPYLEGMQHNSSKNFPHDLIRLYKMDFLPPGFLSRLISRIVADTRHQKNENRRTSRHNPIALTTSAWQNGISITNEHQQIDVERLDDASNAVYICVSIQSDSKEFLAQGIGFIVDHVEYLIKEWYSDLETPSSEGAVLRLIPCPVCVETSRKYRKHIELMDVIKSCTLFKFKDLTIAAIVEKQDQIQCQSVSSDETHVSHTIPLRDIVPDLFLLDLGVAVLDESELKFNEENKLGEGGFGIVFKAKLSGNFVALKSLLKRGFTGNIDEEELVESVILQFPDFRREISTMSRLQHPCILQMISVSIQKLWFAMEFAPLGDLASYVDDQLYIPDIEEGSKPGSKMSVISGTALERMLTFKIAYQMVAAVEYLHQQGIIHTDLKTDNILLFSTKLEDLVNVKLADYGISQSLSTGVVRGHAGRHIFVAPEIINGKAFNERADIFSIGMILFHIMSGIPPGGHELAIDTSMDTTSGNRPSFEFQDYTLQPNFQHLEVLMKSCWEENPDDRPAATEVLNSMKKPGFLCLRQSVEIENAEDGYITQTSTTSTDSIYIWTTSNKGRVLTKVNLETVEKRVYNTQEDANVSCAFNHENLLIVGTNSDGIQVLERQLEGFNSVELEESCRLNFMVSCLFYAPAKNQNTQSFLYVGLQDGRLVVYEHIGIVWRLLKILQISTTPIPCSCMVHLEEKDEYPPKLLVGCGNIIRTLNTINHTDLNEFMIIPQTSSQYVQCLVSCFCHIWCFFSKSSKIYQFNEISGSHVATFECGVEHPIRDEHLPIKDNRKSSLPEVGQATYDNQNSSNGNQNVDSMGDAKMKEKHSTQNRPQTRHFPEVTSLLAVKDTLWIGRNTGDILVVDINTPDNFGMLQTILKVDPMVGRRVGPVKSLINPASGKVVACREVIEKGDSIMYQLLIWEDWGTKETEEFENALKIY